MNRSVPLTEIEFELTGEQYDLMECPGLRQGQSLDLQVETGVLLPEPGAEGWFAVQRESLPQSFRSAGHAYYAFSGQIAEAEVMKTPDSAGGDDTVETATLLVRCGELPLRVTCAPHADGRLPFGTWETRYLAGYGRFLGSVEEDFSTSIGERVSVTIWGFRRLVLTPGDPLFGEWHESDVLPPSPYRYDRVVVTAKLHRTRGL